MKTISFNDERDNAYTSDLQSACQRLIIEKATLQTELFELEKRLNNAERILGSFDFRRCDIPACNCNSYHKQTPEPEV